MKALGSGPGLGVRAGIQGESRLGARLWPWSEARALGEAWAVGAGPALGRCKSWCPRACPLLSSPVLVAEVVKFFFPAMVQLHSFVPASSTPQKLANWGHLNRYQGGQHCQSGAGPQRAVGSRSPAFMPSGMQIWILL